MFGRVGYLFGGAIVVRRNIHVAMQHKGQLFAVGRKCDLRCARKKRLPVKVCVYFVGYDVHFQFLRLLALFQGIYLTIIAITQRSVVGGGEKTHGVGGVTS